MVAVLDLDGVICKAEFYQNNPDYSKRRKEEGIEEVISYLREKNMEVIIYTSRWEEDREVTEEWLKKNGIDYDKLICGKPLADVYVDDKAVRFNNSKNLRHKLDSLLRAAIPVNLPTDAEELIQIGSGDRSEID